MDLIVLGVDGVDPEYLEKTVEERNVPNWESLKQKSFYSELPSTVPAVTIPAWISMFSGYNPGRFDAYHLSQADYSEWELDFPSSDKFRGDFFWDRIDREVALHYVPGTSPVYPVNGWMRGGFPSPEDFEFYPEEFGEQFDHLERINAGMKNSSGERVATDIQNYETEREIADVMIEKNPDVFVSVIRLTDKASHHSEKERQILDIYEEVDSEIGKVMDKAEEENANLIVASDHGFFHAEKKFNITRFLEKEGYLELEDGSEPSLIYRIAEPLMGTPLKRYLKIAHNALVNYTGKKVSSQERNILKPIKKSSRVLPMHFGLGKECVLKIHTEDMTHGSVSSRERSEIISELEDKLEGLERNGKKVIEKVWKSEDLYGSGSADLAIRSTKDFIVETSPSGKLFENTNTFTHRENGVFFAKGPDIDTEADEELEIYDVGPLIYALLEEKIPGDLYGKLPENLVSDLEIKREETGVGEIDI